MTTIYYTSDLHLEFLELDQVRELSDMLTSQITDTDNVVILAGDIVNIIEDQSQWFDRISILLNRLSTKAGHIIYSLGNHELYSTSRFGYKVKPTQLLDKLQSAFLELRRKYYKLETPSFSDCPQALCIQGGRVCITNITDWYTLPQDWLIKPKINDSNYIVGQPNYQELCELMQNIRDTQLSWVSKDYKSWAGHKNKTHIVVGHFLPVKECIDPKYIYSPVQDYFYVDKSEFLLDNVPTYYIHGHTHSKVNTEFNGVKILANPKGYPRENPDYTGFESFEV